MKKFLLSLAALALSAGAFAQDALISGVTFNVPGQTEVEGEENVFSVSHNSVVSITLNDYDPSVAVDNGIRPMLMWTTGTGFAMSEPQTMLLNQNQNHFTFTLTNNWGNPALGYYFANLMVCFVEVSDPEEFFYGDGEDPLFWEVSYTTPDTTPATLLSIYPNDDWSEESFAEAYNDGVMRFNYSNVVDFPEGDVIGMITYSLFNGDDVEPVLIIMDENAVADWNPWDGSYSLSVEFALEGVSANEISDITVTILDAESLGSTVEGTVVVLNNDNPNVKRLAKNVKKAPIAKDLAVANETVSVYNVAGMLVKENISESEISALPKGLYIVNGKKVVVK